MQRLGISLLALAVLSGCSNEDNTVVAVVPSPSPSPSSSVVPSNQLTALQIDQGPQRTVANGTTLQLQAAGLYANRTASDLTGSVNWSSSNPGVASINAAGIVTGLTPGAATITAATGGVSTTLPVTVSQQNLSALHVNALRKLAPGMSFPVGVTGIYANLANQDLTNQVSYSVEPSSVASVSPSGRVQAVAPGAATLAVTRQGVTTRVPFQVANLSRLDITNPTPLARGTSGQLQAIATFADGSKADVTEAVNWSSGAPNLATVDPRGEVQAVSPGPAPITASASGATAQTSLQVTAATLVSLAITPQVTSLVVDSVSNYYATGTYSDGSTQDVTKQSTWTSSNTSVVLLGLFRATAGQAYALAVGSTTLQASLGSVSTSLNVQVESTAVLTSITVTPADQTTTITAPLVYTAKGNYNNGTSKLITNNVVWSSSNTGVATIGYGGIGYVYNNGTTTITATQGSVTGSTSLTVNLP